MANTRYMTPQEERYMYHLLSGDPLIGSFIRNQMRHGAGDPLANLPVCPKCERPSLYHDNGAICPTCGTFAVKEKTHRVKDHIRQGYYR
ncbi:hypothetical protein [Paenibacillus sp. DMB20]|uniref:hypothetical protein n=1 Tax=Paenibacillus sp. DMB20 TaxID=1642570 RepID=UPI0006278EE3|nr:hypothetical protein [Paenibacillus sp. DMB20]KKO51147.1 hypothetical protein XI25_29615 [Paenibacillus sp. DMB20]